MIDNTLDKTVPFINAKELSENLQNFTILDIRELNEYNVSHLKNAIHVGYSNFDINKIETIINHKKTIVVYCSVGYRSEKIGEKLIEKGYSVYNLYGGIFNWVNENFAIIDKNALSTKKVHCFNEKWSEWLVKGEKIYD